MKIVKYIGGHTWASMYGGVLIKGMGYVRGEGVGEGGGQDAHSAHSAHYAHYAHFFQMITYIISSGLINSREMKKGAFKAPLFYLARLAILVAINPRIVLVYVGTK